MDHINATLRSLEPRKALDIATGAGDFAARLASGLGGYGELFAIDSQPKALAAARKNLEAFPRVTVLQAEAEALPFEDSSFDLVAVANSLHHFRDPALVLGEALRVLAPGGSLLVLEMHREAGDEAAMTHVLLHHWWAAIDSLGGTFHAQTRDRAGIHALLDGLGLSEPSYAEILEEGGEPLDGELLAEIDGVIKSYLSRIPEGAPEAEALRARGAELGERAHRLGFRSAPALFFSGTKGKAPSGRSDR